MSINVFMTHLAIINNKVVSSRDSRGNITYTDSKKPVVGRYAKATKKDKVKQGQKDVEVDIIFYTKDYVSAKVGDTLEDFYLGQDASAGSFIKKGQNSELGASDLVGYQAYFATLTSGIDTNIYRIIKVDEQFDDPVMHHKKLYLIKTQLNDSSV